MKALYRAYRPNRFADVVGQEVAVRVLRNAVARNRLTHAYLFAGPRGVGKTTLAKILAQAANCRAPEGGEPCGRCPECQQVALHTVEMDAASHRGIDEIRDLREKARFAPMVGRKRTYILDEAHMLTPEAFNALLKTLEEPPDHLLFILATTEPERIPETVLSRCQKIQLRRLTVDEITRQLLSVSQQEGVELRPDAASFLARQAEGSLRDALALLDVCITFAEGPIDAETAARATGGISLERVDALFQTVVRGQAEGFFHLFAELMAEGADIHALAHAFVERLRRRAEEALLANAPEAALWVRRLDAMVEATHQLRYSFDPEVVFEAAVLPLLLTDNLLPSQPMTPASGETADTGSDERRQLAGVEPIELEQLRAAVRRRSIKTYALLEKVTVEMSPEGVTLQFAFPSHRVLAEQPEHREVIARTLSEILGREVAVRFTVRSGKG